MEICLENETSYVTSKYWFDFISRWKESFRYILLIVIYKYLYQMQILCYWKNFYFNMFCKNFYYVFFWHH